MSEQSAQTHTTGQGHLTLGFIGFGEAAQAFTSGMTQAGVSALFKAFDIKTADAGPARAEKLAQYQAAGIAGCETAGEAVQADAVFSLVTAEQAYAAAGSVCGALPAGTLFFDCNSCAPQTKTRSAGLIEAAGGRYVDAAVMAPVHPRLHKTPILLSGAHAEAAAALAAQLDLSAKVVDGEVGAASAIKLVRSIMVKGLEALTIECLLAGRQLGVGEAVLESLEKSYPEFGWSRRSGYMLERAMTHGVRRAGEMREAALMVEELGLAGRMAQATAEWEQLVGELKLTARDDAQESEGRDAHLDQILSALIPDRRTR